MSEISGTIINLIRLKAYILIRYFFRKLFYAFVVLFGVLTLVFFLFNVLPGDPARMMLDKREDADLLKKINKTYAFDQPLTLQYLLYLNDLSLISIHNIKQKDSFTFLDKKKYNALEIFSFNKYTLVIKTPYLRNSFVKVGKPVNKILFESTKNTFILAISAILFALFFGVIFGIFSALYKDTYFDKLILFISALGMSLPSFFSAIIIAWMFGFLLHEYTGLNMTGNLYEIDDYGSGYRLCLKNLILPSVTLGIRPLSVIVQLSRDSLINVLSADYIRTAYAKGLKKYNVITKHAIKNSLNPVITAISGWLASMLAGAVFVEYIFAWNGLGKEIIDALNLMDLPVVMGSVLLIACFFIIINILVDLLYVLLDPRIKTI